MRVKMHVLSAGPNGVRQAGREYDVPAAEAADLIGGGYASEVKRPTKETAAIRPTAKQTRDRQMAAVTTPAETREGKGAGRPGQPKGSNGAGKTPTDKPAGG